MSSIRSSLTDASHDREAPGGDRSSLPGPLSAPDAKQRDLHTGGRVSLPGGGMKESTLDLLGGGSRPPRSKLQVLGGGLDPLEANLKC